MSAYKTINCSFKDRNALVECLKNIGYAPVEYNEKHNLMGYLNDTRDQKAEIIVPKNQISKSSNDLGFSYNEQEKVYEMLCSEYDAHKGVADKVKQSYALTAIKIALKKNKFIVSSENTKENKITLNANKII